jgi:uncharacterized protein (DUF433 family)
MEARMSPLDTLEEREFTVPQASAILGLTSKQVNNALDRELVAELAALRLVRTRAGHRIISSSGLLALKLANAWADRFLPQFRRKLLRKALAAGPKSETVREEGIVVELAKHREIVSGGMAKLRAAEELVTRDAEVLGGEPCIRNTRIPVYVVAALANQRGREAARAVYPSLTAKQLELAVLYAKANPRKGRPRTKLPAPRAPAQRQRVKKVKLGAAVEV